MTEDPAPARPMGRPARRAAVPAGLFAPGREPSFVVFTAAGEVARFVGDRLTGDVRSSVYVSEFDFPALRDYLRRYLHAVLADDIPLDQRAWVLHRALLIEAHEVVRAGEPGGGADLLRCARELARLIGDDPAAFGELNALLGGAYTPTSHAVATAIVAVAIAAADGMRDVERLTGVALGGLFADAGKVDVAPEVLDRSGPLTAGEWERMLRHPRRSAERMRTSGVVLAQAVRAALHHHERWDGAGYPEQRRASDIPVEARYVAIADAFTAMTAERPYRAARTAYEAVAELVTDGGYEPRLIRVFVPLLKAA